MVWMVANEIKEAFQVVRNCIFLLLAPPLDYSPVFRVFALLLQY